MDDDPRNLFRNAINNQRQYVDCWRMPAESLLFETLRAIDNIFCQELFYSPEATEIFPLPRLTLLSSGVNHALSRMLPNKLGHGPFKFFQSKKATQEPADEFLFQCGVLQRAELLDGWLAEGLLSARIDTIVNKRIPGFDKVLILTTAQTSLFHEVIAKTNREWMTNLVMQRDEKWEDNLGQRYVQIMPDLERHVSILSDWSIQYSTTREIDDYFLEWGILYLRRMWGQDLIGRNDLIGGARYNEYLGVLAAISGRAQKHLCFAQILKKRYPSLDIRNLLTTFSPVEDFIRGLSIFLDAETSHIKKLIEPLVLDPRNRELHTSLGETVWAPIVRATHEHYILPLYGLEINPFQFLLTNLRATYPLDWSSAANNREIRWIEELRLIFASDRWEVKANLRLRNSSSIMTDIDFMIYDRHLNQLAIFQLKWQQPVGIDNRQRRSAGKNLVSEANEWVSIVSGWIKDHGEKELLKRAGFSGSLVSSTHLFIVARYNAFFSGYGNRDERAVWADWNHFLRIRYANPGDSFDMISKTLALEVESIAASYSGDSYILPLFDLAVILNPSSTP